jgi:hypothetical protein
VDAAGLCAAATHAAAARLKPQAPIAWQGNRPGAPLVYGLRSDISRLPPIRREGRKREVAEEEVLVSGARPTKCELAREGA